MIRKHYINVSNHVRIRGCFSKTKGIHMQEVWGKLDQ